MRNKFKDFNKSQYVAPKVYPYRPTSSLEGKAIFLENTLANMLSYRDSLKYKKRTMKNKGEKTGGIDRKISDLSRGIGEVHEKCLTIWNDIVEESG